LKYSELLAQDEIDALHRAYDYTALDIYAPLKAYLEQTSRWMYDGNGRWSTSDMMARLRSNGEKFNLEVWLICGDVKRVHLLEIESTDVLMKQLRKVGI
jgi:hypothetical protein